MPARPFAPTVAPLGSLLPDFSVWTSDGRAIHRRDFKGRRHLVVCFAPVDRTGLQAFVAPLAAAVLSWRAERAELLLCLPEGVALDADPSAALVVEDHGNRLRDRFGVAPGAALFIADRYGEIVYHATGATAVPMDEVLPILELLEMRCSL